MTNETSVVRMENIHKQFSGVTVLNDVSFDLRRGEVHALAGGNGAGKSTLMKILQGVYSLDSGTVQIDGNHSRTYPLKMLETLASAWSSRNSPWSQP